MNVDRRAAIAGGALATGVFALTVSPASGDQPQAVRAISIPTDAAKQILYAKQSGIFLKHGLRVEVSPMGNGAAIFAAVAGGSADFGSGSLFPVFNAYGHGIPLRIVAPIGIYDTDHCDTWLLVARDSTIHTPRDLNGRIMGADNTSDIYISATRAWLDRHGGDGSTLRATEIPATAQLTALDVGRIDAAVLKPPYLTVAMNSGKVRVLGKPLDLIAPRFLISCWVATVEFIAKHPDIVNAFAVALTEASRYTNAHQADTIEMVAAYSGQDPALLRRGVRSVTAQSVTLAEIQRPLDFAFTSGFIDRHYDARPLLAASMKITGP